MIRSAADVWASQKNHGEFDEACAYVMRYIEKASAEGRRDTVFDPRPVEMYDAVKAEFKKHGYTFKPTGFIGGVWQLTEHICW